MRTPDRYIVGVDLGREVNHSAIAVAAMHGDAVAFTHLERVPLRTGYLRVLAKLRRLLKQLSKRGAVAITIVCDAAGPGQVAIELLKQRFPSVTITPVLLTGGEKPGRTSSGALTVPRRTLLSNLRAMLKKNTVAVAAASQHRESWLAEITAVRADGSQNEQDDLVIASALAVWPLGK